MSKKKRRSPISPHGKLEPFCKKCNRYHTPGQHKKHGNFPKALRRARRKEKVEMKEVKKLKDELQKSGIEVVNAKEIDRDAAAAAKKPRKRRFTAKQDRQAHHIAKSEEDRGVPEKKALEIGYATVEEHKKEDGERKGHQHSLGLTYCYACHALVYK